MEGLVASGWSRMRWRERQNAPSTVPHGGLPESTTPLGRGPLACRSVDGLRAKLWPEGERS